MKSRAIPATLLPEVSVFVPRPGGMSAPRVAAVLSEAGFEVGRFGAVSRTLLDTFDGRLHAGGVRVELRDGVGGTQLVVSGGGSAPARASVDGAPVMPGDLPAGPLRARLAPLLEVRALRPTVRVTARQATAVRRDKAGKALVTVDLHDGLAGDAGPSASLPWAAEVTSFRGYPRAARDAEDLLSSLDLDRREGDTLELVADHGGIDLRGFVGSPTVPLDPWEPAVGGFRRVLVNLADTIEANLDGTIADVDTEFLHELRVAVRRTRSVLSHGKRVLPADGRDHFGAEFRWLGTVTSPARDQDVYVLEWPTYVAPLDPEAVAALEPVLGHVRHRREAERDVLRAHLESSRFRGLLTGWRVWLAAPVDEASMARKSMRALGPVVAGRLVEAQDRLLARGRGIGPATAAEELHELRKDAKRLRYLLECFGGVLPVALRKPFVQRLKALQDNLGEHQDTEVHTVQLRALSRELHGSAGVTAETLVAIGRLTEIFEQRRLAARDEFAGRFAAYDTAQTSRALGELIVAARTR